MNFMGSSNNRILVHQDMEHVGLNETVDIVISPQFYNFLREELALKFTYQARNIAPSLFDDYIDDVNSCQYHVYKCGEDWCFYSYDIEEITEFLLSKAIAAHNIGKIYFAQELASTLNKPVKISEKSSIQTIDGVVTLIPSRLMSEEEEYQSFDINKPILQNGISISSSLSSVLPMKQTIMLTVLFLLLGTIFIVEGNRVKSASGNTQEEFNVLIESNPKLASSMIRKSELNKYTPIDTAERLKRDTTMAVSKMLSSQSTLKRLVIDEKSITATLATKNKRVTQQIETEVKKNQLKVKSKTDTQVILEKSL